MAIGIDCDVMLQHASVNNGAPVRFMLLRDDKRGGLIRIEREAYLDNGEWKDRVRYTLRLLLGDSVTQPNGQSDTQTRFELYGHLQSFLAQRTGITLQFLDQTITDLHASLTVTFEKRFTKEDCIELVLNNGGWPESPPV
jgi:hypothetical protein